MEKEGLIVDRIEGELAICESNQQLIELPLLRIAGPVKEGDLLILGEDGLYRADEEATASRQAALWQRFQKLKKN